jgi:hypothetical protein
MTIEHGNLGSEVSRPLPQEGSVSVSTSTQLPGTVQNLTPGCGFADCGQVLVTLQVVETLGCVRHSTDKLFRERVAAFERKFGLDRISPSRSCVVEYSSYDEHKSMREPSASKEILHPGDVESSVRDRLAISNIFETLSERCAGTKHHHIYFTLSGEHMQCSDSLLPTQTIGNQSRSRVGDGMFSRSW